MKQDSKASNYCKFNSQLLTLFTSSFHISAFFASLLTSHATTKFGRLFSMRIGGAFVIAGAANGAAAINVYMLILSRIIFRLGVGFTIQSLSLYLSEMALARYRGAIFNIYDICLTSAILIANLVNYGSQKIEAGWGWRISLGAAAFPAIILFFGAPAIFFSTVRLSGVSNCVLFISTVALEAAVAIVPNSNSALNFFCHSLVRSLVPRRPAIALIARGRPS